MAKTITFSESVAANTLVPAQADVADSPFNPVEVTSKVSLYAAGAAAGTRVGLQLGSAQHAVDAVPPTAAALSSRDHLVATGVAFRGQKITVTLRNTTGGAVVVAGMVVVEPL